MTRVLIVDDDPEIGRLLCAHLAGHGLQPEHLPDGRGLLARLAQGDIDVLLLDWMLPGTDGRSWCQQVRARHALPILMLTALGDVPDRIVGLESGADDYMVKPFDVREVLARIQVLLRRPRQAPGVQARDRIRFADWTLQRTAQTLQHDDGLLVPLSGSEFRLLMALLAQPRRVIPRAELQRAARRAPGNDRSIDLLVSRLRRKLRDTDGLLVSTVRGEGYRLDATPA